MRFSALQIFLIIMAVGGWVVTTIGLLQPEHRRSYGHWAAFLVASAVLALVLLRF